MKQMKQVDFDHGSIAGNLAQTTVPMMVAQLLSLLYNIVDRIYIGRIPGAGTLALGGVGLCFPILTIVLAFANLYGVGGSPLCAIARGSGDHEKAEKVMNTSFGLLIATALILTAITQILAEPTLYLFGATDANIVYALPYIRIYLLGTVFSMIATGLNPYINAQGYSAVGMITIFIGALTNIILDPLFIFVLGMGTEGAAIATVISQILSALFVVRFLTSGKTELSLSLNPRKVFAFEWGMVKDIVGLGFASFIMQFTNSLAAILSNHMLSAYGGELYVSAYTVVASVRQILDVPIGAITDGSSPILGYNYGAGRFTKLKRAIRIITYTGVGYTLVVWGLILAFPGSFFRIFSSDTELISLGTRGLRIYFFAFLFQALQYTGQNVFRSLNHKKEAIFFSLFRKVIIVVPLTVILPGFFRMGTDGVFMAEPISNVIGGCACFLTMYLTIYRKLREK